MLPIHASSLASTTTTVQSQCSAGITVCQAHEIFNFNRIECNERDWFHFTSEDFPESGVVEAWFRHYRLRKNHPTGMRRSTEGTSEAEFVLP